MSIEIQSVARSFSLIEYLAEQQEPQLLKTIAKNCGLPSSTVHRLLQNLISLGYVNGDGSGRYHLTLKLFRISSQTTKTDLMLTIKPYLDELSERLREAIYLVVREGNYVVNIYSVSHSTGSMQMASKIGLQLALHRTAVGKSLLAHMTDVEIIDFITPCDFSPITPNTITDPSLLMDNIRLVREKGYSVDDEENEVGIICFAGAIVPQNDAPQYAFGVSAIKSQVTESRKEEIVKALLETKRSIEKTICFV